MKTPKSTPAAKTGRLGQTRNPTSHDFDPTVPFIAPAVAEFQTKRRADHAAGNEQGCVIPRIKTGHARAAAAAACKRQIVLAALRARHDFEQTVTEADLDFHERVTMATVLQFELLDDVLDCALDIWGGKLRARHNPAAPAIIADAARLADGAGPRELVQEVSEGKLAAGFPDALLAPCKEKGRRPGRVRFFVDLAAFLFERGEPAENTVAQVIRNPAVARVTATDSTVPPAVRYLARLVLDQARVLGPQRTNHL